MEESQLEKFNLLVNRADRKPDDKGSGWDADWLSVQILVERLEDKESIINGISNAIMLLNAKNHKILDVNHSFLKSYGLSYDQALGKTCYEVTHHLKRPCSQFAGDIPCPLEESYATGKRCHVDHIHKDSDGKSLYFEITAYPLKDASGQVTRIVHLSRDVTYRRLVEEALKRNSEKVKLFAYSVAHDLKSPAVGIHSLTQRLYKHYAKALDEKGKNYCSQILKASEQIVALVKNINLFISAKETPLSIEQVKLEEILRVLREEFSAQLNSRCIRLLESDNSPEIKADRLSVTRMLRNLIDNALKYGGDNLSEIRIGHEESEEFHIISVADDGIGVGKEESKKIFDPFQRNHQSRRIEGTGLGLAIVKEIAKQHGGKVWSERGTVKGTIFYMAISKDLTLSEV